MLGRGEIIFAFAVTHAGFGDSAARIQAKLADELPRPAAAVAGACQTFLGREHPVAAMRGELALEIPLVAEQPEPALHFPGDLRRLVARDLGKGFSLEAIPQEQQRAGGDGTDTHLALPRKLA